MPRLTWGARLFVIALFICLALCVWLITTAI
jgi:hypothetical protein